MAKVIENLVELPNGKALKTTHIAIEDIEELSALIGDRGRLQIKGDGPTLKLVYWPEDSNLGRCSVRRCDRKHLAQVLYEMFEQVGHERRTVVASSGSPTEKIDDDDESEEEEEEEDE